MYFTYKPRERVVMNDIVLSKMGDNTIVNLLINNITNIHYMRGGIGLYGALYMYFT